MNKTTKAELATPELFLQRFQLLLLSSSMSMKTCLRSSTAKEYEMKSNWKKDDRQQDDRPSHHGHGLYGQATSVSNMRFGQGVVTLYEDTNNPAPLPIIVTGRRTDDDADNGHDADE